MYYKSKLRYPGTLMHHKLGRIDLCLLTQEKLKELYENGCMYISLVPGDAPNEQPIEVKKTPSIAAVEKPFNKKGKSKAKLIKSKPPLPDDSLEKGDEAPD
jgi:hypothetical protein